MRNKYPRLLIEETHQEKVLPKIETKPESAFAVAFAAAKLKQ